jgi:hypothetical protein
MTGELLTGAEAAAICKEFVPIGEEVFGYVEKLEDLGFSAFRPAMTLTDSCCQSTEELELHRKCTIESAKISLGRPWPFKASKGDKARFYASPFLDELKRKRDEDLGIPMKDFMLKYPEDVWRLELDPCKRRCLQSSLRSDPTYLAREEQASQARIAILSEETARHIGYRREDVAVPFEHQTVLEAAMQRELLPLGFKYDAVQSRADYPVFSKAVGRGWALSWALDDSRSFSSGPTSGHCNLLLQLRSPGVKRTVERARTGGLLIIRHGRVVPGFQAYSQFSSFSELELVARAHLTFYRLIAPIIEHGAQKFLGRH